MKRTVIATVVAVVLLSLAVTVVALNHVTHRTVARHPRATPTATHHRHVGTPAAPAPIVVVGTAVPQRHTRRGTTTPRPTVTPTPKPTPGSTHDSHTPQPCPTLPVVHICRPLG